MKKTENIILGLTWCLIIGFWLILLFKIATTFLPHGAFSPNRLEKANFRNIIPQGWAFFTRNPKEENYFLYQTSDEGKYIDVILPNRHSSNGFGIKRTSRIQGMELGSLISRIEGKTWLDCPLGLASKVSQIDTLSPTLVINGVDKATLSGEYLLVKKSPVPWAWGESYFEIDMPAKAIKINVLCLEQAQP